MALCRQAAILALAALDGITDRLLLLCGRGGRHQGLALSMARVGELPSLAFNAPCHQQQMIQLLIVLALLW